MSNGKKQNQPSWKKPQLKQAGNVADVLQGGGGKLSVTSNDSGDVRKPNGQS